MKSLQKAAIHSWLVGLWTKDTKTDGRWPNGKEPVFLFQANAALGMDYYSRRVLTGAAVDGRVTVRFGSALSCECGLRSPDREHLTFTAKRSHGMVSSGALLNVVCWFHLWMLLLFAFFQHGCRSCFGYSYSAIRSSSATHLGFGRQLYHSYFL